MIREVAVLAAIVLIILPAYSKTGIFKGRGDTETFDWPR